MVASSSLKSILAFFTGAEEVPPLGFCPVPTLRFNPKEMYLTSSTCAMELVLPTQNNTYEELKKMFLYGLDNNGGFGKS